MAYTPKNAAHFFTIGALIPVLPGSPITIGGKLTFDSPVDRLAFATELAISGGLAGVASLGGLVGAVGLSTLFAFDEGSNTLTLNAKLAGIEGGEVLRCDTMQTLSGAQKAQGRENLGVNPAWTTEAKTAHFTISTTNRVIYVVTPTFDVPLAATLPLASSVPVGFTVMLVNTANAQFDVQTQGSDKFNGPMAEVALQINGAQTVTLIRTGTGRWTVQNQDGPRIHYATHPELPYLGIRYGDIVVMPNSGWMNSEEAGVYVSTSTYVASVADMVRVFSAGSPDYSRKRTADFFMPNEYGEIELIDISGGTYLITLRVAETHVAEGGAFGEAFMFALRATWSEGVLNVYNVTQLMGSAAAQTARVSRVGSKIRYTMSWDGQESDGRVVMEADIVACPEF